MSPDDAARTPADAVTTSPRAGTLLGRLAGEAWVGFALGLFGLLVAVWAFLYEGLFTGRADPHDQLAGGLRLPRRRWPV